MTLTDYLETHTQQATAELLGTSQGRIADLVSGRRAWSMTSLAEAARVLGLDVAAEIERIDRLRSARGEAA